MAKAQYNSQLMSEEMQHTGTAGRIGGIAAQLLEDRLGLLALELREAKIRLV